MTATPENFYQWSVKNTSLHLLLSAVQVKSKCFTDSVNTRRMDLCLKAFRVNTSPDASLKLNITSHQTPVTLNVPVESKWDVHLHEDYDVL